MNRNEPHTDKAAKVLPPNLIPPDLIPPKFAAMGQKRFEELVAMQKELVEKFQQMNRNWFDRMQSDATMASEFATELTAVRSLPETATFYQKWAARREDAKRLLADGQSFMETGAHLLSKGWLPNGHGGV